MIKILICDDQEIVCEGLHTILSASPDLEVVGTAYNGEEALHLIPDVNPNLVLMDLKMPVMNGVTATRKIKEQFPDVHVLVLTTYDDDEWIFDAVRSGAEGYLLKDTPPEDLVTSIIGTVSGKSYLDPKVAGKILADLSSSPHAATLPTNITLTEKEREILAYLTGGCTNAEIAERMFLAEGTVRNYTSLLFKKLGVSDRTQAAVLAIRYGLV